MSVEIDPNMPGLAEASQRLDELMAEESAATVVPPEAAKPEASATPEPRAAHGEIENAQTPNLETSDTPAEAEPAAAPESDKSAEPETQQPVAQPKAETDKSRYAKSQERLTRTWEAVNAEKTSLTAEKAKLETERAELARQRAEWDTIRQQAEQPQHPPEAYEQAAASKRQLADHQMAQAARLEDNGKFDEAEALRKQSAKNEAIAEDLAEHADKLRRNPPATFREHAAQFEQSRKAWTLEAAKAYPELAKDGSALQTGVARELSVLAKADPKLGAQPAMIYHVTKLVAAELRAQQWQTEAARVPELVKELGGLKAKVKELEALTTPGSSTTAPRYGAASADDDEAGLERMARELVTLR